MRMAACASRAQRRDSSTLSNRRRAAGGWPPCRKCNRLNPSPGTGGTGLGVKMPSVQPVLDWLEAHETEVAVSTLSVAEIRRGIELKRHAKRLGVRQSSAAFPRPGHVVHPTSKRQRTGAVQNLADIRRRSVLAVLDYRGAVHEHMRNAGGIMVGVFISGGVLDLSAKLPSITCCWRLRF